MRSKVSRRLGEMLLGHLILRVAPSPVLNPDQRPSRQDHAHTVPVELRSCRPYRRPNGNNLAFILNTKTILLGDRPPAQAEDGRTGEVGKDIVGYAHR